MSRTGSITFSGGQPVFSPVQAKKQTPTSVLEAFNRAARSRNALFASRKEEGGALQKKEVSKVALSNPVLSGADVASDLSGHLRNGLDLSELAFGTANPQALQALEFSSIVDLIQGSLEIKRGVDAIQTAKKASDVFDKNLGILRTTRGAVKVCGSVVSLPMRALVIASLATGLKSFAQAAGILGCIGVGFSGISGLLSGIYQGVQAYELYRFNQGFESALEKSDEEAFKYLKGLVSLSDDEKMQIGNAVRNKPKNATLSADEMTAKIATSQQKRLLQKQAFVKRVLGEECYEAIANKLSTEIKEVLELVESKRAQRKIIYVTLALAGVSLGIFIASLCLFTPYSLLIIAGIQLAMSTLFLVSDGYALYNSFEAKEAGRYDRLWIYLSTVLTVLIVATVSILSSGVIPIATAAVFGVSWILINIICARRLAAQQKKEEIASIRERILGRKIPQARTSHERVYRRLPSLSQRGTGTFTKYASRLSA